MNYRNAGSLDALLTLMRAERDEEVDWTDLPTFGGPEPASTDHTWSWDKTRLLRGTCPEDLYIVERAQSEAAALLGRKGGSTVGRGVGASKRRGGSEHYRAIRAKRRGPINPTCSSGALRYFADCRQITGTPWLYQGYVRDRETGRVVQPCCNRIRPHRSARVALACAEKSLRRFLRCDAKP